MRIPEVGDILLFTINETPRVERPLLVTHVAPPSLVTGELFFATDYDGNAEWARKHMFYKLLPGDKTRSVEVKGIAEGLTLGTWRWRSAPVDERSTMQKVREAIR